MFGVLFGYATAQGQIYGALLDGSEQQAMSETFQYALENAQTNQVAAWVNPDTGNSGTLVPVRTFYNDDRQSCREFVATIIFDGVEQQGQGTACRQLDGLWLIVPEESVEYRPIIRNDYTLYSYYPYGYVDWYSRFPYYLWDAYYPSIFFSFNVVHFSRHHHSHRNRIIHNSGSFRDKRIIRHQRHFGEQRNIRKTRRVRNAEAFQNHKQVRSQGRLTGQRKIEGNRQVQGIKQRKSLVYGVNQNLRENRQLRGNAQIQNNRRSQGQHLRVNSQVRGQRPQFGGRKLSGNGRFEELRHSGGGWRGGHGRR
jgi:surface antigen